jgi:hypothetical protein
MSYPQKFSTGAKSLWDTPNTMRKLFIYLTGAVRSNRLKRAAEADSARGRIDLMGKVYAITAVLSITGTLNANAANYSIDHLKLYSHSRILDYKEFQCFNKIITKESRWSIDASLRYITNRYQTPCKAWAFHQERNYY